MSKPTVLCSFIKLEKVGGNFRAYLFRTSGHPVLGPEREGQTTITSRVIRVDFDMGFVETLNTYYVFQEVV